MLLRLWLVIVLALLMLMLFGLRTGAQTPDASPASTPVPVTLDGLQEGVTRQYAPDPSLVPADNPEAFSVITVHIFRFDTPEHAAAAWQSLRSDAVSQFQPAGGEDAETIDVHEEEVSDIGDQAYVAWLSASPNEGLTGHFRALYVQEGELLYLLTAIAGNEQNTLVTEDIARAMVEDEPGSSTPDFNADGTSTGGLWDILPTAGDDVLQDLVPIQDRQVAIP